MSTRIQWVPSTDLNVASYTVEVAALPQGPFATLVSIDHDLLDPLVYDVTAGRFFYVDAVSPSNYWYRIKAVDTGSQNSQPSVAFQVGQSGSALTSIEAVKAYLGNTKTTDDDLFGRLVLAASAWFESQTNRRFALQSYTDTFIGQGDKLYIPQQAPVTGVTSVTIDGEVIPVTTSTQVSGYMLVRGLVHLIGYTFGTGQLVEVVYTAGFATIPADVEAAVIELACDRYKYRQRQGKLSETVGGEYATYVPSTVPQSVNVVVAAYRRVLA